MALATEDTRAKALALNLDPAVYGTIAEIGAGQEVARWFFRVGGAAGTVAKTISAYDMEVSDQIYGKVGRYVSRERLVAMLDHEYDLLLERLGRTRGGSTTFFAFADTAAARNYQGTNECRGWVGLRFQVLPGGAPSDVLLHVHLLDAANLLQQEALGILGVNLIHAAFHRRASLQAFLGSLLDGLSLERIELDTAVLSGPAFESTDPTEVGLGLVRSELADAVLLDPSGALRPPGELLRKRPIVVERGRFVRPAAIYSRMLAAAERQLRAEIPGNDRPPCALLEMSVNSFKDKGETPNEEFRSRLDALRPLGHPILVSRLQETYRLTHYLRRHSREALRFVGGTSALVALLQEGHYRSLAGGLLEGVGRLLADNVRVYVHPMDAEDFRRHLASYGVDPAGLSFPEAGAVTAENLSIRGDLRHLYTYLRALGWIVPAAAPS